MHDHTGFVMIGAAGRMAAIGAGHTNLRRINVLLDDATSMVAWPASIFDGHGRVDGGNCSGKEHARWT
ncbi:MAG: hypothetical protein ONB44_18575 [candidate division KSB1 bacterium]|nr:hypothetical protein [candidate division KSB1 bacterium]MDZ7304136.1 hypothetical protein [candidate division KSB1 bacterium]MDZ7314092.1 hypothetical protein [candidate division KSB1 bacterium]